MRLRMMGSSLFSGSFVQPRMPMAMPLSSVSEVPTRWTSLPSMATTPRVAISDSLLRLPGQLPLGSCTGLDTLFFSDTKWSGLVSPFCSTYSNASSAVAPSQPPVPPHLCGFWVQAMSCSAENRFGIPLISARAFIAWLEAMAQQLPQSPWSSLGAAMVLRFAQENSAGISLSWKTLPRVARKEGNWVMDSALLLRLDLWPRSAVSSSGVQSDMWLTLSVQSGPLAAAALQL
mmetsp:Transcript_105327/g.274974  ORF Transcript_105327/g.274974 Transcript_105327/m.274974 type:complete len:232 (-) Transcript_105327:390-1085(-)